MQNNENKREIKSRPIYNAAGVKDQARDGLICR